MMSTKFKKNMNVLVSSGNSSGKTAKIIKIRGDRAVLDLTYLNSKKQTKFLLVHISNLKIN